MRPYFRPASRGVRSVELALCLAPGRQFIAAFSILVATAASAAEHVIHISVDGLNASMLQSLIDAGQAPNFKRLQSEGAWTNNARTDYSHTNTLPNHTTMLTGRPVLQPLGLPDAPFHNWTSNSLPQRRATIHQKGYIPSVFDVVHDAGLSTGLYASKEKFVLFDQSYDETTGAQHDHGRDKIDTYFHADDGPPRYSASMNERFLSDMANHHFNYTFIHYRDPDAVGHFYRWGSSTYRHEVIEVDSYLGEVLHLVESDPKLAGKTTIILNTDHGGTGFGHINPTLRENYTIPIIVWGAGVTRGDLYALNRQSRTDPGDARVEYTPDKQPIRNGDTGNLALSLLGLGPIPTSTINAKQDLRVALAGDYNQDGNVDAADSIIWERTKGSTTDLRADGNHDGRVDQADHDLWKANFGESAGKGQ